MTSDELDAAFTKARDAIEAARAERKAKNAALTACKMAGPPRPFGVDAPGEAEAYAAYRAADQQLRIAEDRLQTLDDLCAELYGVDHGPE